MIEDVTNSPKDWDDFWNQSKDITPQSINNQGKVRCYIDNEEVDCQTWKYIKPHRTLHNYLT